MNYRYILIVSLLIILQSCAWDCIDKKTGSSKSSSSIDESKHNGLFLYELKPEKYQLHDTGIRFNIKNAWVEHGWSYECENNEAVIKKHSYKQIVVKVDYKKTDSIYNYSLMVEDFSMGARLGSQLSFTYNEEDPFILLFTWMKDFTNYRIIDTVYFVREL